MPEGEVDFDQWARACEVTLGNREESTCMRCAFGPPARCARHASTCGECGFCRSGRENLCDSARFTGLHRDGAAVLVP